MAMPRSEPPRFNDPLGDIRYSRWDGTQRLDALEAEELLGAMSDELLSGGDPETAMARLARWGIPGRMEGLKDLLERLRAAKQRRAERHDLSRTFDELKEKLEEVKRLERDGLERRRAAPAPNEQLKATMEKLAAERTAQLDALPEDFGRAMRALKDYEFVEPKAAEKYQELLGAAFNDPALQEAMNELAETLGQLVPADSYDHQMSGDEPLTLAEALGLMDEMNQLSDMEDVVRSARNANDLADIDRDQVERLAGQSARQSLDELRRMTELLEEAGLIRKDGDRYELTPRGIRKIGQRSLEEIFATLKRDAFGGHRSRARGRGGDPTDELKTDECGDPFLPHPPGTGRSCGRRTSRGLRGTSTCTARTCSTPSRPHASCSHGRAGRTSRSSSSPTASRPRTSRPGTRSPASATHRRGGRSRRHCVRSSVARARGSPSTRSCSPAGITSWTS